MRVILLGAVAFAFTTSVALAEDMMATRYGNTTITRTSDGVENHVYYNSDGTFTAKQGDATTQGTWAIKGGTICLTANPPIPNTPNPACAPLSAHQVGDTWTAGPYTVSLVAGIQ